MIELIEGLPDGVIGIEAVGNVTLEDYDDVVAPAVERALASHPKIRLLHVLGDRLRGTLPRRSSRTPSSGSRTFGRSNASRS